MKGVGSGGGFVFTERVDYTKPGDTWIPIPLVAVFEVNERGKIFAWREYLDGGNVARKNGIEVSQPEESQKSHPCVLKMFRSTQRSGRQRGYRNIRSRRIC